MKIIHKDNGRNGVFIAIQDDKEIGEMTYMWSDGNKLVIDHTGVRPQYEGKGVGKQLVEKSVEFAREKQVKIVPLCSFARAIFERYPEFSDIKA